MSGESKISILGSGVVIGQFGEPWSPILKYWKIRFFRLKSCRMIPKLPQSIVLMSYTSTNVLGPIRTLCEAPRVQKLSKIMIFRSFGAFWRFEKLKNENQKKMIKKKFFQKKFFLSNIVGLKYMEIIFERNRSRGTSFARAIYLVEKHAKMSPNQGFHVELYWV